MMVVRQVTGDSSGETEFVPQRSTLIAAGAVIAATYFYFLIFAQFALLELAEPLMGEETWRLRSLMLLLGGGGLAGSLLAALRFDVLRIQGRLSWSFRGCAVGAALALGASTWSLLLLAALVSGAALGALTVNLAASLRPVIGTKELGWVIGVGTGVAYALCNVPGIFEAGPKLQTILAAVVTATASVLSPFLMPQEPSISSESDYRTSGLMRWVGILAMLVWLDSAAFYVIQHEAALQAQTWQGAAQLWTLAIVHLSGALLAGWLLDRKWRTGLVVAAYVLLAGGCLMLARGNGLVASIAYAAGVSLYSVVLVYFPARSGWVWVAALTYGVAGWVASAMGIGMAQDLQRVPGEFLLGAGVVIVALGLWQWRASRAVAVLLGLWLGAGVPVDGLAGMPLSEANNAVVVQRGREVYIGEGCIHCHSQYLRPTVEWELRQGEGILRDAGTPPLFGNRRQGPDLTAVGRRLPEAEWQREHLRNPRQVRPGSRMPSYAHLFANGDRRGPDLVAYLLSLREKDAS